MSILSDTFENASKLTRRRWLSISRNRVPSSVSMNREIAQCKAGLLSQKLICRLHSPISARRPTLKHLLVFPWHGNHWHRGKLIVLRRRLRLQHSKDCVLSARPDVLSMFALQLRSLRFVTIDRAWATGRDESPFPGSLLHELAFSGQSRMYKRCRLCR
jgi:hypothetical protein